MTNLKCELFVLADHASISQEQKLSINGIFDQFFVADVPTNWSRMYLVGVLRGDPYSEHDLTLKVISPKGHDSSFPEKTFKIKVGPSGKSNVLTELVNFPLVAEGSFSIELLEGKEKVAQTAFKVVKTTATYGEDLKGKKVVN